MVTMSAIDPALIILVNIYCDMYQTWQEAKVYNNGVMQVSVFVSVNYNGEGVSEDEIIEYVQNNVDIYSLNFGENVQWAKSTTDNGFPHDIDHVANKKESVSPNGFSDIRVPLYFTVPGGGAEGEHRWIAKLNGKQTSTNTPLTVTVETFKVDKNKFEIVDRVKFGCIVLRVLKYTDNAFPSNVQKLVKCFDYQGIKFSGTGGNVWISLMAKKGKKLGGFIQYRETRNIQIAHEAAYGQSQVSRGNFNNHCAHGCIPESCCDCGTEKITFECPCLQYTYELDPDDVDRA
uniref:Uncharacterized protein n=1 Tax=Amphimedon queenslandica TaxID=400682 RepID=A0A1X7U3P3_AMPQE